jgi:Ca2+-transporting ATPase
MRWPDESRLRLRLRAGNVQQAGACGARKNILSDNASVDRSPKPDRAGPEHGPVGPFAQSAEAVLQELSADVKTGLTAAEVARRRERFGLNELESAPPEPLWRKFLRQFSDVVVWLLIVAAIVSGLLREWTDATAILAIVLLNAILGFVQEEKAGRALAALQKLAAPMARVLRDGQLQSLPARELVPGDVIDLDAGDNVPADARLIEAFGLRVQEAALTGESTPVDKDAQQVFDASASLGDRQNMVYMGTIVAGGKAHAVVVATGMQTELGRIAGLLESYEVEATPLQQKLAQVGKTLAIACLVLVAIIFVLEFLRGRPPLDTFLVSVSLAVAAVPEGLPAVVTLSLALGLQRMVKRNVLIRKLPSVETLGAVTVICSDKTGTLTRNELTVREIVAGDERYQVTGAGYTPQGEFRKVAAGGGSRAVNLADEAGLRSLLTIADRCNHAQVLPAGDDGQNWKVVGDPTEGALRVLAMKVRLRGVPPSDGLESRLQAARSRSTPAEAGTPTTAVHDPDILHELPFDSERKAMSIVVSHPAGGAVMYTKGAPEVVLGLCTSELRGGAVVPLTGARRREIAAAAAEMASRALRVLAFASRDWKTTDGPFVEEDLVFAGLVGMIDPPRDEVRLSVAMCRAAGIRPMMITGDHPDTALAIARELGLAGDADRAVTGSELDKISDAALEKEIERIPVYARVTAEHKLRIVRAWKKRRHVVAMTGDGVNDAPAVKAADIGIAMGVTGTDVTRETSDMVLMDDNFASIVSAVEEGRAIYDNIQKFLIYLLSCNIGEMLLMLMASILGYPAPLQAVHLLTINLVTDGLPALALGLEPPEPGVMTRPPRPADESMLSLRLGVRVLWQGALLAGVALGSFTIVRDAHPDNPAAARTMTFCVVVSAELFRALAARSRKWTFVQLGPFTNPYVFAAVAVSGLLTASLLIIPFPGKNFSIAAHAPWEWVVLGMLSLTPVTVIELTKLVRQRLAA